MKAAVSRAEALTALKIKSLFVIKVELIYSYNLDLKYASEVPP
jgi:hypothetical protein